MRAVIQRVSRGNVTIKGKSVGEIKTGLVVLLGVGQGDEQTDVEYLVDKILNLRIFSDKEGKMNLSPLDIEAELLLVPQFTLYGDCREGRRPSFAQAASPGKAEKLYNQFVSLMEKSKLKVQTGEFKKTMKVSLDNEGPVTILLDSNNNF